MQIYNNPFILGAIIPPFVGAVICLLLADNNRLQRQIGVLVGALAWVSSIIVLLNNIEAGPQVYRLGGWTTPYGIVLAVDLLSALFGVMCTTVMGAGLLYVKDCHDKSIMQPVFVPMFMVIGGALVGCIYTGDIFTLFVFLELMVLSSVVLVATSDNRLGLEAAIKYLLISAMGTLFLLMGIAAVYATFGTLNLAHIARLLTNEGRPLLAQAAAVMLMCAFLLKSAVFPFHFWQPDFHTTAPTPMSAILSAVVVKVGIYGIIRLVTLLFTEEAVLIGQILLLLGLIGIFFGSLSAFGTYNAKRMLAYSTFGQIGFILVGIGWGTPLALVAAIVYTVNHAFIKAALLMLTGVVSSFTKTKTARLSEIVGVGHGMKLTSGLYFLGGMALAGVPPLNGFISKVALVQGGIEATSWVILGLVVAAGLITMLYMFRTWQLIFQQKPDDAVELKDTGDSPLAPALLIGICVLLGVYAVPLIDLAHSIVAQISNPQIYITAVLGG